MGNIHKVLSSSHVRLKLHKNVPLNPSEKQFPLPVLQGLLHTTGQFTFLCSHIQPDRGEPYREQFRSPLPFLLHSKEKRQITLAPP